MRRAEDPLRVVLLAGLMGALLLGAAYFVVDSLASRSDAVMHGGDTGVSAHPVLNARRAPATLSQVSRTGQLRRAMSSVSSRLPSGSCLRVDWLEETIVATRSTQAFVPASASKIVTAAVALEVLGADHVFETSVYADQAAGPATVPTLYVVGGGDPSIVTEEYVAREKNPTRHGTSLESLVDAIVATGVRRVSGGLSVIDSRYDAERYVDSWPSSFHAVEAGPLGALMFNDASVIGRPFKGDDPAISAGTDLTTLLGQRGVSVDIAPRRIDALPPGAVKIASVSSAPLSQIVTDMLVNSDNNTAELLLKEIGFSKTGTGSTAAGIEAVASTVATWGLSGSPVIGDGSGLSRVNSFSCDIFVEVVNRGRDVLPGMLAIAGRTGTLENTLMDTPAEDVMAAKTGTLSGVKSLVGYQQLENEQDVTFALIMNQAGIDNQSSYRPIWNALAEAMGRARAVPRPDQLSP